VTGAATLTALEIARDLLRFRSITPADDGALPYLAKRLAEAGFTTQIQRFSATGTADVDNLWARFGTASPCLAFAGHTDVVPPGDESRWRFGPFAGDVADGRLWGRGAADMKGGVAASVAAALRVVAADECKGSIAFLITGDEEGPAVNGTVKLVEWAHARGEQIDHCVLGEPTSVATLGDTIKNGRRGSLTGRLRVIGKQGHVAYPHLADNPIRGLPKVIDALLGEPLDSGTADFDPSNLEIASIDVGNPATNVIPGEVRAVFNVRFNDLWSPESLADEIRRRLAATGVHHELTFDPTNSVSFLTPRGPFTDLVALAVEQETGTRPKLSTGGGTSDARFIKDICPVVELGLLSGGMHGIDEHASLDDLEALSRIYERVLRLYFASE
jgi:succinyl-diaminopimelate desuccinylase